MANHLEQTARRIWLESGAYQHYGRCDRCGRVRDENDRPLFVVGKRRRMLCLDCFDQDGQR
jgi:hypothetical protein